MIARLLSYIRKVLDVSTSERRGAMVLLLLLMLVVGYYFWVNRIEHSFSVNDEEARLAFIEEVNNSLTEFPKEAYSRKSEKQERPMLKDFDPNTFTYDELVEAGLSSSVAKNIVAYRGKVGNFTYRSDLLKLYALSKEEFQRIEPFIDLPENTIEAEGIDTATAEEVAQKEKEVMPFVQIDVNEANKQELMKVKGIGPYYAQNILKYRDVLGGFYDIEQLYEVYNLPDSVVRATSPHFVVNTSAIRKIKVKEASFKEVLSHPYLSYQETKALLNYLKQHPEATIEDLQEMHIFSPKQASRLEHYLEF